MRRAAAPASEQSKLTDRERQTLFAKGRLKPYIAPQPHVSGDLKRRLNKALEAVRQKANSYPILRRK